MLDGYVKIMADYASDGVWAKDGCSVPATWLPVSNGLLDRLAKWCQWYEDSEFYMPSDGRKEPFDVAAFTKEGLAIAKAVKSELPSWTVEFFDEERAQREPALDYLYEV